MRLDMNESAAIRKRKVNRLSQYDYSQNGAYFITICTKHKRNLLWEDVGAISDRPNADAALSEIGSVVEKAITDIPAHYPDVTVDKYVVMPNHVHMILMIDSDIVGGRTLCSPTISRIIKQMKEAVTKCIGTAIWQKSFYDRVIRNRREYEQVWEYIDTNVVKWELDCYYNEGDNEN